MPRSSFRPAGRGRKARNSPPNPCVKDREPRHRQAPVQGAAPEARCGLGGTYCVTCFTSHTHNVCPSSIAYPHKISKQTFSGQTGRDNLPTLLPGHPLHFRFKTRWDVKLNHMCHNIPGLPSTSSSIGSSTDIECSPIEGAITLPPETANDEDKRKTSPMFSQRPVSAPGERA